MKLLLTTRMDSLSKVKDYQGPLLVAHSDGDEIVPYSHGQQLYDAAPTSNKRFLTMHGGKHNTELTEEYRAALDEFIDGLPPVGALPPSGSSQWERLSRSGWRACRG